MSSSNKLSYIQGCLYCKKTLPDKYLTNTTYVTVRLSTGRLCIVRSDCSGGFLSTGRVDYDVNK